MSKAIMHLDLKPSDQHVFLDGVEITHLVHHVTVGAGSGEITSVQLEIQTMGVVIPEALMDVMIVDAHDALRLREMLADAIIALDTCMEAHDDAPTPALREQMDRWRRHQEFPGGEKLGRYIERVKDYDQYRNR